MARYELLADNVRRFWEVTLGEDSFSTRAGVVGTPGDSREFHYATAAKAKAACEALTRSKLALGFREVDESAPERKGLWCAENPELEAAIVAAPDSEASWAVYGDWLQSQGDLRGELIARQREQRGFERFVGDHLDALFGDVAPYLDAKVPELEVRWRHGFVHSATLRANGWDTETKLHELAQAFLALPVTRFLKTLELLIAVYPGREQDFTLAIDALAGSGRGETLQGLRLGHDTSAEGGELPRWGSLARLSAAAPNLLALVLAAPPGELGRLSLPRLQALDFAPEDQNLRDLAKSKLPVLARLVVNLRNADSAGALAPILEAPLFPLKHLRIAGGEWPVSELLFGGVLPKLRTLELYGRLDDEHVSLFLKERKRLKHLEKLELGAWPAVVARQKELESLCRSVQVEEVEEERPDDGEYYDDVME